MTKNIEEIADDFQNNRIKMFEAESQEEINNVLDDMIKDNEILLERIMERNK